MMKDIQENSYPRRSHEEQNRKYNRFRSLSDDIECYKCKKFIHVTKDCRLTIPPREPKKNINNHKQESQRIWIRKQDQFNTKNETYLYKLNIRNMDGMLIVDSQII
jgi:hypothetical protein